jgi:hypothetical protein
MVEPRSSHPFEDLQPVNVEDEVRQEKKETSGLSVQGDHPYLITDRKMGKFSSTSLLFIYL